MCQYHSTPIKRDWRPRFGLIRCYVCSDEFRKRIGETNEKYRDEYTVLSWFQYFPYLFHRLYFSDIVWQEYHEGPVVHKGLHNHAMDMLEHELDWLRNRDTYPYAPDRLVLTLSLPWSRVSFGKTSDKGPCFASSTRIVLGFVTDRQQAKKMITVTKLMLPWVILRGVFLHLKYHRHAK